MTALESADGAGVLRQLLAEGQPDVLCTMVAAFANALISADADAICARNTGNAPTSALTGETVTGQGNGTPRGRHDRAGDPEATHRHLFSRVVAGASPPRRAGSGHG